MSRRTTIIAVAVVLLSGGIRHARANPADMYGFAGRGPGMASALTAGVQSGAANYYNPAALAALPGLVVDLGYQYASHQLDINGVDQRVSSSHGAALSFSTPGKFLGRRVALGGGFFIPDNHLTRTRTLSTDTPRFALYDNRPQRLFLAANIGIQLTDRIFIGGGLSYISQTKGSVTLRGRVGFPVADDSDLYLNMDVDLLTIRYGQVGILVQATPWLKLGATYRSGFELKLDQVFTVEGDVGPPDTPPVIEDGFLSLTTISQDHFQPETMTVGAFAQLTPRLALAFDLAYFRWSKFPNPAAVVDLLYDLKDFNSLFDIPEAPALPSPHYSDIIIPRVGVEYLASSSKSTEVQVRGGYSFEPSPSPDQVGQSNLIDNNKHTFTLGGTLTFKHWNSVIPRPASIDAYFGLTLLESRQYHKLSPVDPVGDYKSTGKVYQMGIASRWRF